MKLTYRYTRRAKPIPFDLTTSMGRVANYMVSATQRRIAGGVQPPNAPLTIELKGGERTLRDRGGLMASIAGRSGPRRAEVGSAAVQARILQQGGVVTAKRAKSLAIPASARTRTLMRQYGATPRACIEGMQAAGYSVWRPKADKDGDGSVLMARKGKRGVPFALFFLKRSVHIPARPYLFIDEVDEIVILSLIRGDLGYRG